MRWFSRKPDRNDTDEEGLFHGYVQDYEDLLRGVDRFIRLQHGSIVNEELRRAFPTCGTHGGPWVRRRRTKGGDLIKEINTGKRTRVIACFFDYYSSNHYYVRTNDHFLKQFANYLVTGSLIDANDRLLYLLRTIHEAVVYEVDKRIISLFQREMYAAGASTCLSFVRLRSAASRLGPDHAVRKDSELEQLLLLEKERLDGLTRAIEMAAEAVKHIDRHSRETAAVGALTGSKVGTADIENAEVALRALAEAVKELQDLLWP